MSKRFVPRGADPTADALAAAESPLPGAVSSRPGKRAPAPAPAAPRPAPAPRPPSPAPCLVGVAASPRRAAIRADERRLRTLRDAAELYGVSPDGPVSTAHDSHLIWTTPPDGPE